MFGLGGISSGLVLGWWEVDDWLVVVLVSCCYIICLSEA